jgi:hypothetical protein
MGAAIVIPPDTAIPFKSFSLRSHLVKLQDPGDGTNGTTLCLMGGCVTIPGWVPGDPPDDSDSDPPSKA